MTNTARKIPEPQSPPIRKVTAAPLGKNGPKANLRPVLETMIRIQREVGRGVFAFTAPNSGAGTTFIVNLLARELAAALPCSVAIVPVEALDENEPSKLPQGYVEHAPNVWVAVADRDSGVAPRRGAGARLDQRHAPQLRFHAGGHAGAHRRFAGPAAQ